jgi:hypothetical protein
LSRILHRPPERGTPIALKLAITPLARGRAEKISKPSFGRHKMVGISKQQQREDEESLAMFLIFFNVLLLGAFLLICFYQSLQ